ncbi:MAG: metallophosphoesterase family protein [Crocinitomicaceae bacterium]|nr:metallophosphoesterase family protein [Crocinitomicaceae bacterium]
MTRIGLISDTHGWLDERVFHHFAHCDEIWHTGDIGSMEVLEKLRSFKPLKAVYGNIDDQHIRMECPENIRWQCEEVDTWLTHIGGRPGNYAPPVREKIKAAPPDLFICGHSHLCLVQMDKKLSCMYMNPGAAGRHGFHRIRTLLRFTIDGKKIDRLEVIELGLRVTT